MSNAIRLMVAVIGVGGMLWAIAPNPTAGPNYADPVTDYTVSGPYTHDNLTIFLLHGPDTLPTRPVKTLDEAIKSGTAIVHETGNVNQLCVENLSADDDLMIQNGDILKGGRQDRVAQLAMILPPKSGKVAMPAFCVEQSRWSGRGQEPIGQFAANPGTIAGKDLKLAVNVSGVQGEVWKNVATQQAAYSAQVGSPVNGTASPSSLQLALENKSLQSKVAGYQTALMNTLVGKKWVIGYAIAVNGKITGAEVFGSETLMTKAWPKALNAAAFEAIAEKKDGAKFAAATEGTVTTFLADAGREQQVARTELATASAPEQHVFRSYSISGLGTSLPEASVWDTVNPSQNRTPIGPFIGGLSGGVAARQFPESNGLGRQIIAYRAFVPQATAVAPGTASSSVSGGQAAHSLGYYQPSLGLVVRQNQTALGPVSRSQAANSLGFYQSHTTLDPASAMQAANALGANPQLEPAQWPNRYGMADEAPMSIAGSRVTPQSTTTVKPPPVRINRIAGKNGVMVESRDRANPGVIVHRTFIAK